MWSRFLLLFLSLFPFLAQGADSLRVMTFNVRLPLQSDGVNSWDNRRDIFVETVRKRAPDLMGTQELYALQAEYIVEKLPQYTWFGLSRRGNHEDEHMGVFYLKDRLKPVESGNYWLSETPEVPGSSSWGIPYIRMVTWALFEDLKTGRRFFYYNTHFPHREVEDEQARLNCANIIVDRLLARPPGETLVMTGDFNTDGESATHEIITGKVGFKDAWIEAASKSGPLGTFHEFKGVPGRRIDWILYRGSLRLASVETITDNQDGRYPSDHFPVLAVFEWQ
jgi:endonuclease/exonuclease/phosphatase family metal-dependent hydrolase